MIIPYAFNTKSAGDGVEQWLELCRKSSLSQMCHMKSSEFDARIRGYLQPGVQLTKVETSPCVMTSKPEWAPDSNPEVVALYFMEHGRAKFEQGNGSTVLNEGEFTVVCGDRPFMISSDVRHRVLCIKIDRNIFSTDTALSDFCAKEISTLNPVAPLVDQAARSIWGTFPNVDSSTSFRLVRNIVDLFEAALDAHQRSSGSNRLSGREQLLRRIKSVVSSRINEEKIGVECIAQHMRLSSRYINRLFSEEGTSLGRYIADCKLSMAARMLLDPSQKNEQVATIGGQAGFANASHFSVSFKKRYGCTPGEFRRMTDAISSEPRFRLEERDPEPETDRP